MKYFKGEAVKVSKQSSSAWRMWIEIWGWKSKARMGNVILRMEDVD